MQDRNGPFYQCDTVAEDSSWHGTQTSGLIGALTNNGIGMASVGRIVRILPVRVLGKCGGFDSDIIAGMRWAAGLDVPGAPVNPTPARVLNLSLGGDGACTAAYTDAVAEINAAGAVVVASAGNEHRARCGLRRPIAPASLPWRDCGTPAAKSVFPTSARRLHQRTGRQLRQYQPGRTVPVSDADRPRIPG